MKDVVAYGAEHSTLGPVAARAATAEGFALTPDPRPDEVIFVRSDQYPFVRRGIPALYLDNGESARDPTQDARALYEAFTRDRYHQPSDDVVQTIDYPTLGRLAAVNARVTLEVANAPERPRWNAGDFFGDTYGKGTPSAAKPRCKCAEDAAATTAAR
jgi:Zn-dependent M28 family amino/carboxypeptidase